MARNSIGFDSVNSAEGMSMKRAAAGTETVAPARVTRPLIGVLPGEGIGPQMVDCALQVLTAVESVSDVRARIEMGGLIGLMSRDVCGLDLSPETVNFCTDVFRRGGGIIAGAGGGRFVYDLRKQFDLYVKFSPLKPPLELANAAHLKPAFLKGVDIIVVRDNIAGIYQGRAAVTEGQGHERIVVRELSYSDTQVRRLIAAGAALAAARTGRMTVVVKHGGMPVMTALWRDIATEISGTSGVQLSVLDADHCAYRMIQYPCDFDVLVAPNLVGDILTDLGAVLLGSRGLSFSGNFSEKGDAVYQTNHGSAYDLVGTDKANPAGQLFALAMMLRESFGLHREADWIEAALSFVWRQGWRTADVSTGADYVVGTQAFTARVAAAITDKSYVGDAVT
jgi:3-isopropylmalate dehydrogenase